MRTCTRCQQPKPAPEFVNRNARCRACVNADRRARRDYAAESPGKRAAEQRDPEKHKESYLRRSRRQRASLTDGYVRRIGTWGMPAAEIPQPLVELKRGQLALKREAKRQEESDDGCD